MAIDFFLHVVPGGAVGISPQPAGTPHELIVGRPNVALALDWEIFQFGTPTCTNAADTVRGLAGWRVNLPVGGTIGDALAGIGIDGSVTAGAYQSFPHFPPMASLFSGAATGAAAALFGYYFMETDVIITSVTINNINNDFGVFVAPSWCSGSITAHFGGTEGFGLVWSARLNSPNWHLFISVGDAGGAYFALADTGISALDNTLKMIRVEWGYDPVIAKPVIRGVIDGVTVAEFIGPFVLDTAFELGAFSQAASVGLDCSDVQGATSELTAFFGCVQGIRIGGFLVTPPSPPVPPVVNLTPCSVITPTFFEQSAGAIPTFQPCSGTGQPGLSQPCG